MKLWGTEYATQGKCNLTCDFKETCNKYGSNWIHEKIVIPTKNLDLENAFNDCGSDNEGAIVYTPSKYYKKRRF